MKNPELTPQEEAELKKQRESQQSKQPYAAELDAHEMTNGPNPVDRKSEPKTPRRN